jgi:hypothetical protein
MTDTHSLLLWISAGVIVIAAVLAAVVASRSKRMPGDHVFRASRWSRGNHLFPAQVAVSATEVVQYVPGWVGRREHTIHMAHIASVDISTNLFFSNVVIETSGGSDPVRCHGHRKHDAMEMKRLINEFQSAYYKGGGRPPA